MWASFAFLKKLPKENCNPMGENWPNLVTLSPRKDKKMLSLELFLWGRMKRVEKMERIVKKFRLVTCLVG
jgi:hypothetical protein